MPAPHLSPQQERFAQELAKGHSAAKSYELAGYNPNRHNAAKLARKEHISSRVDAILTQRDKAHTEATEKAVERVALTKEWILARLMENVERALQHVAVTGPDGEPTGEYTYNGMVANRALELLGKTRGMFIDRQEVGDPGAFEKLDDAALRDHLMAEAAELGIEVGETQH